MKKSIIPAVVILVLSLVIVIGSRTFLSPCVHEDGTFGPCHWAGQALFANMIHSDLRAAPQVEEIKGLIPLADYYAATGNRIDVHSGLPKYMWLQKNAPDVYARAWKFVNIKDYLYGRMTGRPGGTDRSDGSLCNCLDMKTGDWAWDVLGACGVDRDKMPELRVSADVSGRLTAEFAARTGLPQGLPVAVGAGDGACAAHGARSHTVGDAYINIGSSAWVSAMGESPCADPAMRLFSYFDADERRYNVCGTVQSGSAASNWAIGNLLCPGVPPEQWDFAALEQLAASVAPGADGVMYLPTLAGERTPWWTAKASDGNEYTGAEVTSEGFQIFGLPPYNYYSAGYACFVYGPNSNQWMQDNHDVWNNSMDLAGIQNGGIIGFKYFGFGGLAQDAKGCKAFEGTKPGDGTKLTLNLTPGGKGAFKIHVLLDDPWKGKEIATINVPADAKGVIDCVADVPAVEGLTGKHALYLVADGPDVQQPQQPQGQWGRRGPQQPQRPQGLFDLHGRGFGKSGNPCVAPRVPQVTITVDGKQLNIPDTPIRSTNANGLTDAAHYQLYAPMKAGAKIEVKASDPSVTYTISTGTEYRATVKATYKGQTKTFLIN